MAFRKVNDDSLATVADAIRAKGGTSEPLGFPDGFINAISAIQAEGGVIIPEASYKDVNFRDYDGTILYSYTKDEALSLTSLPDLPTKDGLICQGWNWSLEKMQSHVRKYGKCEIGATYITDDGKTRIYITLHEYRTSPMLGVCLNGTVTVDWGDGTTPDVLTGISISNVKWTPIHNYASAGDYVIELTVDGRMIFYGSRSLQDGGAILRYSSSHDYRNYAYRNSVKKIEIGSGVTSIGASAFYNCNNLTSITIPKDVNSIGSYAFSSCGSLRYITIPEGVKSIEGDIFFSCKIMTIAIPEGVTSIGAETFYYCNSLMAITIPEGINSIESYAFSNCISLTSIIIPEGVKSIGTEAFYNCNSLAKVRFNNETPPTVSSSSAFTNIPLDCIISIPVGTLSAYTSATNYPSSSKYTYIEED